MGFFPWYIDGDFLKMGFPIAGWFISRNIKLKWMLKWGYPP
jgi:hypothetical protein